MNTGIYPSKYVTRSDKIGLIAEKYTCSVYGVYQLICGCYLNIMFYSISQNFLCIYIVKI